MSEETKGFSLTGLEGDGANFQYMFTESISLRSKGFTTPIGTTTPLIALWPRLLEISHVVC